MTVLTDLFDKKNFGQLILCVLFVIYLALRARLPGPVAVFVHTIPGIIIVVFIAVTLLSNANPVLGMLGLLVAFNLLWSSSHDARVYRMQSWIPTETKKYSKLTEFNQFPSTLEEEVVKQMAPLSTYPGAEGRAPFQPTLDDQHSAAYLTNGN